MPNRILHESIKYCPKMEQLNWFEEVVYHRLTVSVDDYGCLDGRIVLLKNTLFPTREDISKDDIARAIEHMVALGLLRAYEAGGMPYLCFPAWEKNSACATSGASFPLRRTRRGTKKSRSRRKIPCPRRTAALFLRGKNT